MYITTSKKSYGIEKALEAAQNIKMDLQYVVQYEKKAEQAMLIINRGAHHRTSTKWKLYIEDNGIKVEKKWTFDQCIFFIAMLIWILIAGLTLFMLVSGLILSLIEGQTLNISGMDIKSGVMSVLVGIVFVVMYKSTYYARPKKILLIYFEKYIVGDVSEDSVDEKNK